MEVICVTNRQLVQDRLLDRLALIASVNPKYIILREKDLSTDEYKALAAQVLSVTKGKTTLMCNSQVATAKALGTGLHLPLSLGRELCNTPLPYPLGISTHSVEDAKEAEELGADYIIFGHIFATDCKKGLAPRGVEALRQVCSGVTVPVYAIGGITPDNAVLAKEAGAEGVCLMSSLMTCGNPMELIERIKSI